MHITKGEFKMGLKKMELAREGYLRELRGMREWISGSLVVTDRKQGDGIHPFRYLSRSIGGKNRITYVSEKHMGDSGSHSCYRLREETFVRLLLGI
jgi:hypothetical protein